MEGLLWARHFADYVDCKLDELLKAKLANPDEYTRLHKGTPFYWLGVAAFASHDYQSAVFFFDAAASEDLKGREPPRAPDRPALLFMCLRDDVQEQAARQIVKLIADKLRAVVSDYKGRPGCNTLSFEDVRKQFLERLALSPEEDHRRTLATTLLTFLAEWDYRSLMIDLSEAGSKEPFFTHLFRGCLLFESLIKESGEPKPDKKRPNLGDYLREPRFQQRLGIGKVDTSCDDFEALVQSLREDEDQSPHAAIQRTAQARNTLGHNLVWATQSLDRRNYNLLTNNIASSCLHAISTFYVRQ
jgi:hypothetical protein